MLQHTRSVSHPARLLLAFSVLCSLILLASQEAIGSPSPDRVLATINGLSPQHPDYDQTIPPLTVTQGDYEVMRERILKPYRLIMGPDFDVDNRNFRRYVLEQAINQSLLLRLITSKPRGFSNELRNTIVRLPAAYSRGDRSVFYPERYYKILAMQGTTAAEFETRVLEELVRSKEFSEYAIPVEIFESMAEWELANLGGARTVSVQRFQASEFKDDVEVTVHGLNQWYAANLETLRNPPAPYVNISYLILDKTIVEQNTTVSKSTVSEAELEAYFEKNKAFFQGPEQRQVRHILLAVDADAPEATRELVRDSAQTLAEQLQAEPNRFAQYIARFSEDEEAATHGEDLGWVTEANSPPQLREAIFSLEPDTVSEVIEGPSGFHVTMVAQVQPNNSKSLNGIRNNVREKMRQELAAIRFDDMIRNLTEILASGNPKAVDIGYIQIKLKQLNDFNDEDLFRWGRINGVTRLGLVPPHMALNKYFKPKPGLRAILNHPRVLEAAFSARVTQDHLPSNLIEVSPETYVVVTSRIQQTRLLPTVRSARDYPNVDMQTDLSLKLARRTGLETLRALREGEPPVNFSEPEVVSRIDPGTLTGAEVEAAMMTPEEALPRFIGADTATGFSVLKVHAAPKGQEPATEVFEKMAYKFRQYQAIFDHLNWIYNTFMLDAAVELIDDNKPRFIYPWGSP